jgi:hypothetical protein
MDQGAVPSMAQVGILGRTALRILLLLLALGGCAVIFRQGLLPWALNPLPIVDLAQSNPWFIDWRLAALRHEPGLCKRVLVRPHIEAQPIADHPLQNGCGWSNAIRMFEAGGVHASFDKITCELAAALALWLEHDVQELALAFFGQRVAAIRSFGAFACRNILGNPLWKYSRSEHATANAVDIGGFTFVDGRVISVRSQWNGDSAESRFLKAAHARACRYFRVVLGPEYNAAHHDHFHLDRGPFTYCK